MVKKSRSAEEIYEEIEGADTAVYARALDELVDAGFIVKTVNDVADTVSYQSKDGLTWSDVAHIVCPVKKQILLSLIDNPRAFFVLYNTQKGKSAIVAREIRSWAAAPTKVVAFLIVDNDKTLADQTNEGLTENIDDVAERFLLSSGAKEKRTVDDLQARIDAYAADKDGDYKMPVIVALNNPDQIKKVQKLMHHIKTKVEMRGSALRYGVVFDEADKVYPKMRTREFKLDGGVVTSFKKFLVDSDIAVHRLGFVTATEGELLDDFEECANAYSYPVEANDENYRAIHTQDAEIKCTPHRRQDSNDAYAEKVLEANREHFAGKVMLKDGTQGWRKTIVNGGARKASQESFARRRNAGGANTFTINQDGVTLYRAGVAQPVRRSSKGVRLSQLLFDMYKEFGLHTAPLFIIGRRKVDRGLGFHHAPPPSDENPRPEGLIWTDMILGSILDKELAAQKAGRLAGRIWYCLQCPTKLTWWTDEQTAAMVVRHNTIVDKTNEMRGHTMLQAVVRAKAVVPDAVQPRDASELDEGNYEEPVWREFDTLAEAKAFAPSVRGPQKQDEDGFFLSSTTGTATRLSYADVMAMKSMKKTSGFGVSGKKPLEPGKTTCTMYVCYRDLADAGSACYVVGKLTRKSSGGA